MASTPLQQLNEHGQSVWVDYLSRTFIEDGDLAGLVDDGVHGVTSNPTIFQAAIAEGDAYDEQLKEVLESESEPKEIFLALAVRDIKAACDVLKEVHDSGVDGWVSLEVDPNLAHDTAGHDRRGQAPLEARRQAQPVREDPRHEGGPAGDRGGRSRSGIPINVTLIFSLDRHREVAEAYIRGVKRLAESGGDPSKIASVASFFVSRVDTEADKRLDEIGGHDELKGKLAIANAKLAYQTYKEIFSGAEWEALAAKGAIPAALPVGVDLDQEPRLPRRPLRRGADRAGHGQHDAARDDRGVPGPRRGRATRSRRTSTAPRKLLEDLKAGRHRLRRRRRRAREGGRREVRQVLQGALLRRRVQARPAGGGMSELGQQLRVDSVRSSAAANSGHPTSSMSAADLMAVLMEKHLHLDYQNPDNPNNDHLIFSKGHASPLYYSMLKAAEAISDEDLLLVPQVRLEVRGPPGADAAVGRRGHRLARPGPADLGRRRAGGQEARSPAVPRLVPVR